MAIVSEREFEPMGIKCNLIFNLLLPFGQTICHSTFIHVCMCSAQSADCTAQSADCTAHSVDFSPSWLIQ